MLRRLSTSTRSDRGAGLLCHQAGTCSPPSVLWWVQAFSHRFVSWSAAMNHTRQAVSAHHGDAVAGHVLEHQHLPEHAAALQLLQNGAASLLVDALDDRCALRQHAQPCSAPRQSRISPRRRGSCSSRMSKHAYAWPAGTPRVIPREQRGCADLHCFYASLLQRGGEPPPAYDDRIRYTLPRTSHHKARQHVDDRVLLDEHAWMR